MKQQILISTESFNYSGGLNWTHQEIKSLWHAKIFRKHADTDGRNKWKSFSSSIHRGSTLSLSVCVSVIILGLSILHLVEWVLGWFGWKAKTIFFRSSSFLNSLFSFMFFLSFIPSFLQYVCLSMCVCGSLLQQWTSLPFAFARKSPLFHSNVSLRCHNQKQMEAQNWTKKIPR